MRHPLSLLLGLSVLASCLSKEAADDISDACARKARAECRKKDECSAGLATRYYGSVDACAARYENACLLAVSEPGATTTPDATAACSAEIEGETCDRWNFHSEAACVFVGQLGRGAICYRDGQC